MAVHRKRSLLRGPMSGKRPRRRLLLLGALITLVSIGFLPSAQAQEGSLSSGAATFAAGKYDSTVRQMTSVLQGDKVAPSDAAKALYFRGLAYQKLGQHTRAIADLGAAIWLGLSPSERTVAMVNRSLAYKAAGLSNEADAELASARKSGGSGEVDNACRQQRRHERRRRFDLRLRHRGETGRRTDEHGRLGRAANAAATAAAQHRGGKFKLLDHHARRSVRESPSSGNRLSRWWGSVRGNSSEPAPGPPPAPPPQATAAAARLRPGRRRPRRTAAAPPETRVATASPNAPAPAAGGGNYRLQLSPTRSEAEARALWKTVAKQNQQIAGLEPSIEKTDMGNLGTFYRLQIGPFPDKAESLKLCNALKRSGVDCFLVNP